MPAAVHHEPSVIGGSGLRWLCGRRVVYASAKRRSGDPDNKGRAKERTEDQCKGVGHGAVFP